ncbi:tetratricopeptide repeat protein [candidate division KSB1 bacterium]|nr:tetratricopeptide repeat protein [candidate division KSB1 bacterium]
MIRSIRLIFCVGFWGLSTVYAASPVLWICQPADSVAHADTAGWAEQLRMQLPDEWGGLRIETISIEPSLPDSVLRFDFFYDDSANGRTLQALAAVIEGVSAVAGQRQPPPLHLVVWLAVSETYLPDVASALFCRVAPTGYYLSFPPDSFLTDTDLGSLLPLRPAVPELCRTRVALPLHTLRSLAALISARWGGLGSDRIDVDLGEALYKFDIDALAAVFTVALEQHRLCDQSTTPCAQQPVRRVYRHALQLSRDFPRAHAWVVLNQAAWELVHGDADSAIQAMTKADNLMHNAADSTGLVIGALLRGLFWQDRQNLTQAHLALADAFRWLPADRPHPLKPIFESLLGRLSNRVGQTDAQKPAAPVADAASPVEPASPPTSPYEEAERLYRLAKSGMEAGDLLQALEHMQTFLQQAKQLRSEPAVSRGYFQLGTIYFQLNRFSQAIDNFHHAADYLEMLGDTCGLAKVDNNIGAVYHQSGDRVKAAGLYRSALNLARQCRDVETQIRSLVNLGDLYAEEQSWSEAQGDYDRALALAQSLGDPGWLSTVSYAKGMAHIREGMVDLAYAEIRRALEWSNGSVQNAPADEQAFLRKLESLLHGNQ